MRIQITACLRLCIKKAGIHSDSFLCYFGYSVFTYHSLNWARSTFFSFRALQKTCRSLMGTFISTDKHYSKALNILLFINKQEKHHLTATVQMQPQKLGGIKLQDQLSDDGLIL